MNCRRRSGRRSSHASFICGDTAFLFGGAEDTVHNVMNDLHTLDMGSLTWTRVAGHPEEALGVGLPEPREDGGNENFLGRLSNIPEISE